MIVIRYFKIRYHIISDMPSDDSGGGDDNYLPDVSDFQSGGVPHAPIPGSWADCVTEPDLRGGQILESLLLSIASFWAMKETKERQTELLESHFRQEELLCALQQLGGVVGELLPVKRH